MEGGRNGNWYISRPGKVADKKEVRSTRLKDRRTNLMTSHLRSILSEVLQRFRRVLSNHLNAAPDHNVRRVFPSRSLIPECSSVMEGE